MAHRIDQREGDRHAPLDLHIPTLLGLAALALLLTNRLLLGQPLIGGCSVGTHLRFGRGSRLVQCCGIRAAIILQPLVGRIFVRHAVLHRPPIELFTTHLLLHFALQTVAFGLQFCQRLQVDIHALCRFAFANHNLRGDKSNHQHQISNQRHTQPYAVFIGPFARILPTVVERQIEPFTTTWSRLCGRCWRGVLFRNGLCHSKAILVSSNKNTIFAPIRLIFARFSLQKMRQKSPESPFCQKICFSAKYYLSLGAKYVTKETIECQRTNRH